MAQPQQHASLRLVFVTFMLLAAAGSLAIISQQWPSRWPASPSVSLQEMDQEKSHTRFSATNGEACQQEKLASLQAALAQLDAVDSRRPQVLRQSASSGAVTRVAYHKTRKTGSATAGNIFFHYAALNNKRLYKVPNRFWGQPGHFIKLDVYNRRSMPADFSVYHFDLDYHHPSWTRMRDWYRKAVPGASLITSVREPLAHFLSFYYYYVEPNPDSPSLESYVRDSKHHNPLAADFKLKSAQDLEDFLQLHAQEFLSMIIADRMSESLVVLATDLNWPLRDMLYLSVHDSHGAAGVTRIWDGRPVKPTPPVSSLPAELREHLQQATLLDGQLYQYAAAKLNTSLSALGAWAMEARQALEAANAAFADLCACADLTPPVADFCAWYALDDADYQRQIRQDGYAAKKVSFPVVPETPTLEQSSQPVSTPASLCDGSDGAR